MATQTDLLRDALSGYTRDDLTTIIDRLAGDKDNLHVDLNMYGLPYATKSSKLMAWLTSKWSIKFLTLMR